MLDGVLSQSLSQAQALWKLREDISETLWHWQPYKNDISVLVRECQTFCAKWMNWWTEAIRILNWFGTAILVMATLHLNILKPQALSNEDFVARVCQ